MARTNGRRHEVLRLVEAAAQPLRAADIAERLDAPLSSVRFHLDSLVEAGLLESDAIPAQGRGRPALGYRATAAGHAEAHRAHSRLTRVLVEALDLADDDATSAAAEAGRRWGVQLAQQDAAGEGETPAASDRPMAELVAMLRREGFEPTSGADGRDIELRACPYLDLARAHPGVVCAIHAGTIRGYWQERGGAEAPRLVPFSPPGACRVATA